MASNGEKCVYFLIGGFVGAAVALLFAPKTGEETRNFIGEKYKEGADQVTRKVREGREAVTERSREVFDKVTQNVDRGKETLNRQKEQLTAAIEAGKQAYQEEKRKLEPES